VHATTTNATEDEDVADEAEQESGNEEDEEPHEKYPQQYAV
jgi:hypothetical protein